ncbi:MAG: right-handed parallel beta-helix repeat-containing protein [Phycisphaerae bacterium]|nr:right-handed parallel beta-helix repeat-containing protein [Phycisphaerae bacterium]
MRSRLIIHCALAMAGLLLIPVVAGANSVASFTMHFEGALTDVGGGAYTGTIAMTVGEHYVPGGDGAAISTNGGFDVYAKDGGCAYVVGYYGTGDWNCSGADTYLIGYYAGSPNDAYPQPGGPWGGWYDPDCTDWDKYSLELTTDHWYLRYTPTSESPMSGTMNWATMFGAETDLGTQDGGHAGSAAHGGGARAWDWDCGWGVEVVPLELPGFAVSIQDLGGGQYHVTLTPTAGPVENTTTGDTYATIADAVDASTNGDIINVEAGTYHNDPLEINKQVTLLGAKADVDPAGSTDRGGETILTRDDTRSGFYITASGVTINGFKLGTATAQSSRRVNIYNGATDVTITCNIIMNTWQYSGHGVWISPTSDRAEVSYNTIDNPWWEGICNHGASDVVISNNTVRNVDNWPILTWGKATISGNTVSNCKNGIRADYAGSGATDRVEIIGNTVSYTEYPGINITGAHTCVHGNTVHHCNYWGSDELGDWDYASIHVEPGATNCVITGNTVYDGVNGIQTWANNVTITNNEVYDMGLSYGNEKVVDLRTYKNSAILVGSNWGSGDIDPTELVIEHNSIHGNYWGLFYSADLTNGVDAEGNWWGDASGPGGQGPGCGDGVSANVDYSPWLGAMPGTSPMTRCTDDSIQDAIDASTNGDTINVTAGTYDLSAPISVDKSVTLTGNTSTPGEVVVNAPTSGSTDNSNSCFSVAANNVTIEGFRIQGALFGTGMQNAGVWMGAPGAAGFCGLEISHNEITNCGYGIYLINAQDVEISNNEIWGMPTCSGTWSGKGIALYGDHATTTSDVQILNNEIHDCKVYGIDLDHLAAGNGPINGWVNLGLLIDGNKIYNNGGPFDQVGGRGAYDGSRGISSGGLETGVTICNNEFYGHTTGLDSRWRYDACAIFVYEGKDWSITNNNVRDGHRGVYIWGDGHEITAPVSDNNTGHVIEHNIIHGNAQGVVIGHPSYPFQDNGAVCSVNSNGFYDNNVTTWQDAPINVDPYGINVMDYPASAGSLDAQDNWWGDASGPSHSGNPEGDGDAVSDDTSYSGWRNGWATVTLTPDDTCYGTNGTVTVTVELSDSPANIVGGQFLLSYDTGKLSFVSMEPAAATFTLETAEVVDTVAGEIDYAVGIAHGGNGATSGTMAIITFTAVGEVCNTASVVSFRTHEPPTRLTDENDTERSLEKGNLAFNHLGSITIDSRGPQATAPTDVEVQCDDVLPTAADDYDSFVAQGGTVSDDCTTNADLTFTHSDGELIGGVCGGAITRTYTITDVCSNSVQVQQTITVNDTTDPQATAPTDVEVLCDDVLPTAAGDYDSFVAQGGTASDNCTTNGELVFTHSDGELTGDVCGGTITRTYTITDVCSNSVQVQQTITVNDTTDPQATAPTDVEVQCDDVLPTAAGDYDSFVAQGGTASDNCTTNGSLIITHSDGELIGGVCGGTITRTYTVMDVCSNSVQVQQTITVNDTTDPSITAPDDMPVHADAGLCTATLTLAEIGDPVVGDNCTLEENITVTWERSDEAGNLDDPFPQGDTTITWHAEDGCGNTNSNGQTVTVSENNEVIVDVELSPTLDDPDPGSPGDTITRCITFEFWECPGDTTPSDTVSQTITFPVDEGSSHVADGVSVLVACGNYTCVTAQDELHTLRSTVELGTSQGNYTADFTGDRVTGGHWLLGGNLNNDEWIDILDFGIFTNRWAMDYGSGSTDCDTQPFHADISGNGMVNTADFTFIANNFWEGHQANCCGQTGAGQEWPRDAVSVEALDALGLGYLAVGDLNDDGWLDELDLAAFIAGERPHPRLLPKRPLLPTLQPAPSNQVQPLDLTSQGQLIDSAERRK